MLEKLRKKAISKIEKYQSQITDNVLKEGLRADACIQHLENLKNKIKVNTNLISLNLNISRVNIYYQAIIK